MRPPLQSLARASSFTLCWLSAAALAGACSGTGGRTTSGTDDDADGGARGGLIVGRSEDRAGRKHVGSCTYDFVDSCQDYFVETGQEDISAASCSAEGYHFHLGEHCNPEGVTGYCVREEGPYATHQYLYGPLESERRFCEKLAPTWVWFDAAEVKR